MAKQVYIQGLPPLEIPQGQDEGTVDWVINDTYEFHGIKMFMENPVFGDEVDFKILLPDGITVAKDYSTNTLLTSNTKDISVLINDKDEPAEIPAGLIVRFYYYAVDTLGRKAIMWLRLKK